MREKKHNFIVVGGAVVTGVALTVLISGSVQATSSLEPIEITNNETTNALTIHQSGDVGAGRDRSGAIVVDNTGNPNAALTLYSNTPSVEDPLMRLEIDNSAWDQPILHIRSDADTSHGLIRLDSSTPEIEFVETDQENDKGEGKFEVRVQHDTFQINSRRGDNTTFENAYTFAPFREGAKFGIADYSPDASIEVVTNERFPAVFFSSERDKDGDILEVSHLGDFNLKKGSIHVSSGKVSTFNGGLNITGGCLAINGKCITEGDLGSAPAKEVPAAPPVSLSTSGVMKVIETSPDPIDCNSYDERGKFLLGAVDNKIWVCNGPERGWDSLELSN